MSLLIKGGRPPGIYLPLVGGQMAGTLDMDGNPITAVLDPTANQEAATKKYHDDNLPIGGYTQGARVRRATNQAIVAGDTTTIIFSHQDYDKDNMWEGVTNPDRLTIRTAGIYLVIGQIHWQSHAAGFTGQYLWHSADGIIAQTHFQQSAADDLWRGNVLSTWECLEDEYLELRVYHTIGSGLNVKADGFQSPILSANRIG